MGCGQCMGGKDKKHSAYIVPSQSVFDYKKFPFWKNVFDYLDIPGLCSAGSTCRLFYQIAFSENIVRKFKGFEGSPGPPNDIATKMEYALAVKPPEMFSQPKSRQKSKRELFINLKKSLIMEDKEDSESFGSGNDPTPKAMGAKKKGIKKLHPANRYEQIIYNRGSSVIVLPERMVLPNGVEDVMLYPTAVKHTNTRVFFGEGANNGIRGPEKPSKFIWSKESDPDVLIDQDFDT